MIRSTIFATVAFCVGLGAGCDAASANPSRSNAAQNVANELTAATKREAEAGIDRARAAADEQIAAAQARFLMLRDDYRHTAETRLFGLDSKVADLETKSMQLRGRAAAVFAVQLKQIHDSRAAFAVHYDALEMASVATWDDASRRLDEEWDNLEETVDDI